MALELLRGFKSSAPLQSRLGLRSSQRWILALVRNVFQPLYKGSQRRGEQLRYKYRSESVQTC
jgi:hypothetical protein